MCHITETEKEESFILEEPNSAAVIWMIQQIDTRAFIWVYSPECLCHREISWVCITAW